MGDLYVIRSISIDNGSNNDLTITKKDMQNNKISEVNFGSESANINGEISFKTIDAGFPDNLAERMRIHTNGFVGIGAETPQAPLNIPEDGLQIGTLKGFISKDNFLLKSEDIGGYSRVLRIYQRPISDAPGDGIPLLTVATLDEGSVGIGTGEPKNNLDVKGRAVIGTTYAGLNEAPADGLLVEGKVGIGKYPEMTLDVKGDSRADRFFIGNKWMLSGIGDAHKDDDWLRLFNTDNSGFYGGLAVGKLWVGGGDAYFGGGGIWKADGNVCIGTAGVGNGNLLVEGTLQVNASFQLKNGTPFREIQAGNSEIGKNEGDKPKKFIEAEISFPTPFSGSPHVIATPRSDYQTAAMDTFSVTTSIITNDYFKVYVTRIDAVGWHQTLYLDWIAWAT